MGVEHPDGPTLGCALAAVRLRKQNRQPVRPPGCPAVSVPSGHRFVETGRCLRVLKDGVGETSALGDAREINEVPILEVNYLIRVGKAGSERGDVVRMVRILPEGVDRIRVCEIARVVGARQGNVKDIAQVQIRLSQNKSPISQVRFKAIHGPGPISWQSTFPNLRAHLRVSYYCEDAGKLAIEFRCRGIFPS